MFCRLSAAADASAGPGEVRLRDAGHLGQVAVMLRAWYSAMDRDYLWAKEDVADQQVGLRAHRDALARPAMPPRDEPREAADEVLKVMEPAVELQAVPSGQRAQWDGSESAA